MLLHTEDNNIYSSMFYDLVCGRFSAFPRAAHDNNLSLHACHAIGFGLLGSSDCDSNTRMSRHAWKNQNTVWVHRTENYFAADEALTIRNTSIKNTTIT